MGRPKGSRNKMVVEEPSRVKRCGTCAVFENGECHAYAPRPRHIPHGASQHEDIVMWPEVGEDDWCGAWVSPGIETKNY
jgi:hypothetical protein